MQTKLSKDVILLSELKINPSKVVNHAKNTHRPVLVTNINRGVRKQLSFQFAKISFSKSAIDDFKDVNEYQPELGVPQIGQNFIVAIVDQIETLATRY